MRHRWTRHEILAAIDAERQRQDMKWGGPDHDDGHAPDDWWTFIAEHAAKARGIDRASHYTMEMVQVAALAVAAIEAIQRIDHTSYTITLPDNVAAEIEAAADERDVTAEGLIAWLLTVPATLAGNAEKEAQP